MKKKFDGSITVFLALIFVLILSLVLVSCEQARVAALRSYAQMILDVASESAASDYYRPLFDEYGMFALNLGYGKRKTDPGRFESTLLTYAQKCSDEITITKCGLSDTIPFLSESGEIVHRQMLEAEKDTIAENVIKEFLERLGLLSSENSTATALSRKIGIEAELFRIDEYTLELMRLTDGVRCGVSSLSGECTGYTVEDSFVKRFFVLPMNSINLGINNQAVYRDVYSHCINPISELSDAEDLSYRIINCEDHISMLDGIRDGYEIQLETELEAADSKTEPEAADPDKESEAADIISSLQSEIDRINQQIAEYEELLNTTKRELTSTLKALEDLCELTLQNITQAEAVVNDIGELQSSLQPAVLAYEEFVKSLGGDWSEDSSLLTDSLEIMKAYVGLGTDSNVPDYVAIRSTLSHDRMLLDESKFQERLSLVADNADSVKNLIGELSCLEECFRDFSYAGLQFDYSGFKESTIGDTVSKGIREGLETGLSEAYLDILIDEGTEYSKAAMSTDYLPEYVEASQAEVYGGASRDGASLAGIVSELLGTGLPVGLEHFLNGEVTKLYEKGLEVMYVHDHFESFAESAEKTGDFLTYGQEYILCGHPEDSVNLASVTLRIMTLRLFFSCLYYFTDSTANTVAETVASAADVTGLPFLSVIVKYAILLLWSLEQAMIETSAILSGRKVSIVTTQNNACVNFDELFAMTPELIREKTATISDSGFGLGYEEYILLFLVMTDSDVIVKRVVNMAQENIRYEYDNNFLMINCIAGFSTYMDVEASAKYTRIFKSAQKGTLSPNGYRVSVSNRYSYEGVNY